MPYFHLERSDLFPGKYLCEIYAGRGTGKLCYLLVFTSAVCPLYTTRIYLCCMPSIHNLYLSLLYALYTQPVFISAVCPLYTTRSYTVFISGVCPLYTTCIYLWCVPSIHNLYLSLLCAALLSVIIFPLLHCTYCLYLYLFCKNTRATSMCMCSMQTLSTNFICHCCISFVIYVRFSLLSGYTYTHDLYLSLPYAILRFSSLFCR
jgi:hypothetical protein